jgi:hypothetical protein
MRRIALLIAMMTASTQMWGQGAVGTILGRVTDPAGAVIVGATVNITNRNNFLDSRGYFDSSVPILRQNQFGYSLGGPVYIPKIYNGRNAVSRNDLYP